MYLKVLIGFFLPFYLHAAIPMEKNWHYIWGDSPRNSSGEFIYLDDSSQHPWKGIDFPSNPPERHGQTNVWYKYSLPSTLPPDPAVYIFSIDFATQVYLGKEKIYQFGSFDEEGKSPFEGWPWHLIDLPEDAGGKTLYFRIYSDAIDIGLWGEASVVSRGEQYEHIVKKGFLRFLIGSVAMSISLLFLILYFINLKNREYLYLGFLVFTQGLDLAVSSQMRQLFFHYPLLAQYILAFCYFSLPVGIALFMEQLIGSGYMKVIRRVWQFHLIYLIGALGLSLAGLVSLSNTYVPYDFIYYMLSAPILLFSAAVSAWRGNFNSRLLFVGYLILVLFYLYTTAIAMGLITWNEYPTHYAIFFFLLILALIAYRQMVSQHQSYGKMQALLVQQSKMAKLGEMLQVIAHQWKQPLSSINLIASNLKDQIETRELEEKSAQHDCDVIINNTDFMNRTVEDFKHFFKPNKTFWRSSIHESLQTVMGIMRAKFRSSNIDVHFPEENVVFKTIPNELNQVLLNLIDNARDALESTSPEKPYIRIGCHLKDEIVEIEVEDNAGGIPKESVEQLFDAYYTTKGDQGNGTGLYLCKMIVEESLGGTITVRNSSDGALFILRLPLKQ